MAVTVSRGAALARAGVGGVLVGGGPLPYYRGDLAAHFHCSWAHSSESLVYKVQIHPALNVKTPISKYQEK